MASSRGSNQTEGKIEGYKQGVFSSRGLKRGVPTGGLPNISLTIGIDSPPTQRERR